MTKKRGIILKPSFFFALALCQYLYGFSQLVQRSTASIRPLDGDAPPACSKTSASIIKALPKNESFGACLLTKEDNDLLYEWVAYHYTVLPLRYLFVGSDLNDTHDANDVLGRWADTDLQYWIMNATQFMNYRKKFPLTNGKPEEMEDRKYANIFLDHRQRNFLAACNDFMMAQGVHWVAYWDTDEFIVTNSMGKHFDDERKIEKTISKSPDSGRAIRYKMRRELAPKFSSDTVLDVIQKLQKIGPLGPCFVAPRDHITSHENEECPEAEEAKALAKAHFDYPSLSTLRYVQPKKHELKMKPGKSLADLSQIDEKFIKRRLPNVHQPFGEKHCGTAFPRPNEAVFVIRHYSGSLERFMSRADPRRTEEVWKERALVDYHMGRGVCDNAMHEWFPRFIELVGESRAKYLLGVTKNFEDVPCTPLTAP